MSAMRATNRILSNYAKGSRYRKDRMEKVVFLDRDGVINKDRDDYVKSWDEFEFLPGVVEAIKYLNEKGIKIIIISNQSAIGRGLITEDTLCKIHANMIATLKSKGAYIDAIYYCPHHPDDNCNCRKPKPGLLYLAHKDFNIDFVNSWMIGDTLRDIEAGRSVGCLTRLVTKEKGLFDIVKEIFGNFCD